jgi:microcystin degradation protein MlrC
MHENQSVRIGIAGIQHEANTFSEVKTTEEDFAARTLLEGRNILPALRGTNTEIWGFARRLRELEPEAETVPLLFASAVSGGSVTEKAYHNLWERLRAHIESSLPLDGLFMAMHGAMVVDGVPGGEDATGLILSGVRSVLGDDLPVIVTLDLHANVTERVACLATALIGYRTWPHIDQAERGAEAADLITKTLAGEVRPVTSLSRTRMILQVENGQSGSGPMAELLARLRSWESKRRCLSGSVFLVQPWMDLSDIGCSVAVVTDGNVEAGRSLADTLAVEMWRKRHDFDMPLVPIGEAIERSIRAKGRPVVLADSADSTGSGATGDSTAILRELQSRGANCEALLTIVDEEAVDQAFSAGQGGSLELSLGGKRDKLFGRPLDVKADVLYLGEPSFRFSGPFQTGMEFPMGRVAVLGIGGIRILVSRRPLVTVDPELFRTVGLEPLEAQIVVVKSPNLFKAAYGPIAHEIIMVDSPGLATSKIKSLPFERIPRPFYPFDEDWEGAPWAAW